MSDAHPIDPASFNDARALDGFSSDELKASLDRLLEIGETRAELFGMEARKSDLEEAMDVIEAFGLDQAESGIKDILGTHIEAEYPKAVEDYMIDRSLDMLDDPDISPDDLSRHGRNLPGNLDQLDRITTGTRRAMGPAGMLHDAAEALGEHTDFYGADDVNPHIVDRVAAHAYNEFLESEIDTAEGGHPLRVSRALFSGTQDEFYNLALHHTSRMEDGDMREGYFERLNDLALRYAGSDKSDVEESTIRDFNEVSLQPTLSSPEKLTELETRMTDQGTFNPVGHGRLLYADGDVSPDDRTLTRLEYEAKRQTEIAEMDPLERRADEDGIAEGRVRLDMDEVREQVDRGYPEVQAFVEPGTAAHRVFTHPGTRPRLDATIDECETKGADGMDVHYRAGMNATDRMVSTMRSVADVGRDLDCGSLHRLDRHTADLTEDHARENSTGAGLETVPVSGELEGYAESYDMGEGYDMGL